MAKSDLLRSHDELRAALFVAGKEIRKLNFGRSDTPVLKRQPSLFDDPIPLWRRFHPGMSWREVRELYFSRRAVVPGKPVCRVIPIRPNAPAIDTQ